MTTKKLLVTAACMVLAMGMIAGCAKEETAGNQVTTEASVAETPEVSAEVSEQASEQAETDAPEAAQTFDPDDIKLRNPFIEMYADNVILPAEPDMDFDADVKLELNQLTMVEMGTVTKNLGELTTEDMLSVGYVDGFGDEATQNEDLKMIGAGAKGYSFDAYYDEDVVDRISVMEYCPEDGSDENRPEIAMKFTEFGIQVGAEADCLKQLGVPALIAQIDEDMTYYWQVETEDGGCCFSVTVTDQIINWIEIMIYEP